MKRGEAWWAELPPPSGKRPVLLLSRNEAYPIRELITIAPVTTRIRHIPSEVPLGPADGLPQHCVVNLDNITTIAKNLLTEKICELNPEKLQAVEYAIHFCLGLKSW
jgi:mRNA interferase MazF